MERFNDAEAALEAREEYLSEALNRNIRDLGEARSLVEVHEQRNAALNQRLEDVRLVLRMVKSEREATPPMLLGQALPDGANVPERPTDPVEDGVMSDAEFEAQERGF